MRGQGELDGTGAPADLEGARRGRGAQGTRRPLPPGRPGSPPPLGKHRAARTPGTAGSARVPGSPRPQGPGRETPNQDPEDAVAPGWDFMCPFYTCTAEADCLRSLAQAVSRSAGPCLSASVHGRVGLSAHTRCETCEGPVHVGTHRCICAHVHTRRAGASPGSRGQRLSRGRVSGTRQSQSEALWGAAGWIRASAWQQPLLDLLLDRHRIFLRDGEGVRVPVPGCDPGTKSPGRGHRAQLGLTGTWGGLAPAKH